MTPLTVAEARAILIADEGLALSYEARLAAGSTFGIEEIDAWAKLVKSANDRIAEARAIRIADEALGLSYEARLAAGSTFGIEEIDAWAKLVESANDRIAAFGSGTIRCHHQLCGGGTQNWATHQCSLTYPHEGPHHDQRTGKRWEVEENP